MDELSEIFVSLGLCHKYLKYFLSFDIHGTFLTMFAGPKHLYDVFLPLCVCNRLNDNGNMLG